LALAITSRRSSLLAVLRARAVVVLFAASACRLFAASEQPTVSEPAPPPEAVAPPPEPVVVAPVEAQQVSATVELAALQAVLGRTVDDPAVRELVARLGAPVVGGSGGVTVHAFAEHGVVLRFAADGQIAEVALFGAGEGRRAWRGALPGGLRFGMNDHEVGRSLGADIPLREVGRKGDARVLRAATEGGRTFRGHGVRAHFDRGGLAVVALLPVAAAGAVHLDDVIAYPGAEDGIRGLKVYYQFSVGAPAGCEALDVALRIEDPAGAPIRGRGAPSRRGRAEAFTAVDRGVPCVGSDRAIFVPFGGLDLPAGSQEVRLHLAVAGAGKKTKRPVAEVRARAEFEMPPVALVKLKISRAEIKREVFRRRNVASAVTLGLSSIFKRPKLAPDPFWVLEAGEFFHRSKVKSGTFTPRWTESTAWFPLAEGDTITLHFADEDLADNERLGVVRVGLDQLRAAIRDGAPLAAGWVEGVELAGSQIRDAP
jgi:hypothetical protein